MKKILVTGSCGFIGFHLAEALLSLGCEVIGVDCLTPYYDVRLKEDRNRVLLQRARYRFYGVDVTDRAGLDRVFEENGVDAVVNLAAQAGVQFSVENPDKTLYCNVNGFLNVLEACRLFGVSRLLYASSSSVYGNRDGAAAFREDDMTDRPISVYAASKKANELMAYTYSSQYGIVTTGFRFFTVYGPYGRPDMAYFKFTDRILNGDSIQLYGNGNLLRDFTYVQDVVDGIVLSLQSGQESTYEIYNIGCGKPRPVSDMISILGTLLGRQPKISLAPPQTGDVQRTYCSIDKLKRNFGYAPKTELEDGLRKFVDWYKRYYGKA